MTFRARFILSRRFTRPSPSIPSFRTMTSIAEFKQVRPYPSILRHHLSRTGPTQVRSRCLRAKKSLMGRCEKTARVGAVGSGCREI
jgi:hypothetical protein